MPFCTLQVLQCFHTFVRYVLRNKCYFIDESYFWTKNAIYFEENGSSDPLLIREISTGCLYKPVD